MIEIQRETVNPVQLVRGMWRSRDLVWQMTKREVVGRYRGSILGLLWSFFNPVLMLAIYTFVFSVVFKARWGTGGESKFEFALILFAGLIVYNCFAECINRAPSLIVGNVNYVKKVVFPLETLPLVTMGAALFHGLISLLVLVGFYGLFAGGVNWTLIFVPMVMAPLILVTLGFCWFLASFGVYVRDTVQAIGVLTTVILFVTPIFYPLSALPEQYHLVIYLNPLTFIVEQMRDVLIWGKTPSWSGWGIAMLAGLVISWFGLAWFQKTRKGFADVL